jgi:DNA repair protein RadC
VSTKAKPVAVDKTPLTKTTPLLKIINIYKYFLKREKMKLKEYCPDNRPLERLISFGAENLSNSELLAIIIKTGTKENNVLSLANIILSKFNLEKLSQATIKELEEIKGIGKTKAAQIKALFEISKRITCYRSNLSTKVFSPRDVYNYLNSEYLNYPKEKLIVTCLNLKNEITSKKTITIGTDDQTLFSTKEIINFAIRESANGIIISHNHPAGVAIPSTYDKIATEKLRKACELIDLQLIDHMIFGKEGYYSFKENKEL